MQMKKFFYGRENELKQFEQEISCKNVVGIVGMEGIGKTEFVLNCVKRFFDDINVIWFDCFEDFTMDFLIDFCGYSYILSLENKTINEKYTNFCESLIKDKRSIFFDDYNKIKNKEGIEKFIKIFNKYTGNSKIVIISKDDNVNEYLKLTPIRILGLGEDSLEFAEGILNRYYEYIDVDKQHLLKICNDLKGNPFNIKIALQMICNYGEDSDEYLGNGQDLLGEIYKHITLLEKEFLLKFSVFHGKVTREVMNYILDKKVYSDTLYGLINKCMITYSKGFFEMNSQIAGFYYKKLNDKDFLHRKVAKYYKSIRTNEINLALEEKIFYHLMKANAYDEIADMVLEKGSQFILLGYTEILMEMINNIRLAGSNKPELLFFLGSLYEVEGDFETSIKCFGEAYSNYEIDLNIGIFSMIKHGEILFKKGEIEKSLSKFSEALKLSTQFKYQLGICCSLKGIGQVNFENKDYSAALENFNENLITCTYINDKSGIADAMKDIGLTLIAERKIQEGITYLDKSIIVYKEVGTERSKQNYLALNQYICSLEKEVSVHNLELGRNDLCGCGSGKKYKNCCLIRK